MNKGCGKILSSGQYWLYCGETDMGQTLPVLCTECGGSLILKNIDEKYIKKYQVRHLTKNEINDEHKKTIERKYKNRHALKNAQPIEVLGKFKS